MTAGPGPWTVTRDDILWAINQRRQFCGYFYTEDDEKAGKIPEGKKLWDPSKISFEYIALCVHRCYITLKNSHAFEPYCQRRRTNSINLWEAIV